ncbi:putative TMhelix containing protein [Vibrio phage 496E54-1]|nr:putative TMhelix containing protein [Vibrio phage 495E54-1]CAH9011951.1 putative TMhelix containing protein [Vibrio phage 496E54-1]
MSKNENSEQKQNDFQQNALGKTPATALAICGVIIALSLSFRIAGIDVSDGINRYIGAKATALELSVQGNPLSDTQQAFNEELEQRIIFLEERVDELSEVAHAPKGKLLYR